MNKARVRGILNAFLVPTRTVTKTLRQANEQASTCAILSPASTFVSPTCYWPHLLILFILIAERSPGTIEDLTDLIAEDWSQLGSVRDMGNANKRFFRAEMERTWGQKHLAVLDEEEAQKWLLGVTTLLVSEGDLVVVE